MSEIEIRNKLKSLKVAKWRKDDGGWTKNDEGWMKMMNYEGWMKMMNYEGWMMKDDDFKLLWGFCD